MRRGEVWYVRLDPAEGGEANKTRPCVVVSADALNYAVERLGYGVVTIIPLTSNISRVHEFQVLIAANGFNGLSHDSKAQAEQIRSVAIHRVDRCIGALTAEQMAAVDEAILVHLGLSIW